MKKAIGGALIFSLGFVTGGALAWKLACKKYEKLIDEEVESVKRIFSRYHETEHEPDIEILEEDDEEELPEMEEPTDIEVQILKPQTNGWSVPKIIDEEDVGEEEFYDNDTFHLYSNGTVTDNRDRILTEEEINHYVSQEAIDKLNSDENLDAVYVQNDNLRIYYEIIKTYIPYDEEDD